MFNAFGGTEQAGTLLLLGAAVLVYAVARSAVDLLSPDLNAPGRLAIAHAVPTAAVAWTAAVMGDSSLVLAVVLGTAIAALSVVLGVALVGPGPLRLPASARAWPFVLPIAMLLLMMGFSARLGLNEAAMLALVGMTVAGVWNADTDTEAIPEPLPLVDGPAASSRDWLRPIQAVLTVLLAGLAGWLAVRGAIDLSTTRRGLSPGAVGLTLLSALLIFPHIGIATLLGQTGRLGIAMGAQVGTVLIGLTVVLPVAIAIWHARALWPAGVVEGDASPLPFAVGFWRIEGALLIAASLPLVPIALGRWRPGRLEGAALIGAYLFYLLIITKAGNRWH